MIARTIDGADATSEGPKSEASRTSNYRIHLPRTGDAPSPQAQLLLLLTVIDCR
jgi:hypothetical protein